MIEIKSDAALDDMREAGRVVAQALAAVRREAAAGVIPGRPRRGGARGAAQGGGPSPFLNYHPSFAPTPFPAVICASVNDVIVHGIPDGYRLRDGDLVSIDFGAELDGWTGDAAISFIVGTADPADELLIETTEKALAAGIAAACRGRPPRRHLGRDRHAGARRRVRGAGRLRRPRHRPPHARGPARAQRGQAGPRHAAAARPGARHRADADGRRRQLPTRWRRTGGPLRRWTAPVRRTPSTRLPSPTTAPASSPFLRASTHREPGPGRRRKRLPQAARLARPP